MISMQLRRILLLTKINKKLTHNQKDQILKTAETSQRAANQDSVMKVQLTKNGKHAKMITKEHKLHIQKITMLGIIERGNWNQNMMYSSMIKERLNKLSNL